MRPTRALATLAIAPLIVLAAACGDDGGGGSSSPTADVTVAAAPAVKGRIEQLVKTFKEDNPDVEVKVTSEDQDPMVDTVKDKKADVAVLPTAWLTDPSIAPKPVPFATNNAVIVVPKGNPKHVTGLDAFKDGTSLKTQVCGTPTPIGTFILLVMKKAGVTPAPDTVDRRCEDDAVKGVVDGDLDAAAMYRFGFRVPEGAEVIPVAPEFNLPVAVGTYVMSEDAKVKAFVDYLGSDAVKKKLVATGYVAG